MVRMKNNARAVAALVLGASLLVLPIFAAAWSTLSASEAKAHVGEQARVCGVAVSTKYAERSNGSPTFINLDRPYPDHIFTVVIWGEDRPKFKSKPPETFEGRKVCVDGEISTHKGRAQIIVREPGQIEMQR